MLKAVLIDDEQENINALQIKLSMVCPEVNVAASFTNPADAIVFFSNNNDIDILFLDVEMPVLNGFQLLDALASRNYEVIMVTAYAEYALKAIKASALDYLLKPVEYDELRRAVNKVIEKHQKEKQVIKQITELSSAIKHSYHQTDKILLHSSKDAHWVQLSNIIRVEGENNYSIFCLKDGPKIVVSKTLKEFEEKLETQHFFRVNRSQIINLNYLTKLLKPDVLMVQMTDGTQIEVSIRRKAELLKILKH
ncbi:MAG: LytR/AlgR family response regulator transcription factor [Chitinophagaceae bacterium]